MRIWWIALLLIGGCGDGGGGGAKPRFTVIDPGTGMSNAKPLDPLPVGERRGGLFDSIVVYDQIVHGDVTVKRLVASDEVLWISENEDGQSLYASLADGVLANPLLLVPAKVKKGMRWQVFLEGNDPVYTFTVKDVTTSLTPFGMQPVWQILQENSGSIAAGTYITFTRTYVEGYGELLVEPTGSTLPAFSSFVIPFDAAPAAAKPMPVAPEPILAGGMPLELPTGEPSFISALDHGDGSLSLEVGLDSAGRDPNSGLIIRTHSNICASYSEGGLSMGCADVPAGVIDVSGALYANGKWSFPPRDGSGETGVGGPIALRPYFMFNDQAMAPRTMTSMNGYADWYLDGTEALPVLGAMNHGLTRYAGFLQFPLWTFITPPQVDANGVLPIAAIGTTGLVTFSRLRMGALPHVEPPVAAFAAVGVRSVRTSASEREMIFTQRDGEIDHLVLSSDGARLERLAQVEVPSGQLLAGAVRLTKNGASTADDPLLVLLYEGPPLEIVALADSPPPVYSVRLVQVAHLAPAPVAPPPSLAVGALRVGANAEVCWPPGALSGLGTDWQLGGVPVAGVVAANRDGSCVLLLRDPATRMAAVSSAPPADAWHVEGTAPGIGHVALFVGDAQAADILPNFQPGFDVSRTVPLAGGGFISTEGAGNLYDDDGLLVDRSDFALNPDKPTSPLADDRGGGLWYFSIKGATARAYQVGRKTISVDLPASFCAAAGCLSVEAQGFASDGGVIVSAGGATAAVLLPDGTYKSVDPPPATIAIPGVVGATPVGTPLTRLPDGRWCGEALTHNMPNVVWCQETNGTLHTIDVPTATGGVYITSPPQPLADGTLIVSVFKAGSFLLDAATYTLKKYADRRVAGISRSPDGLAWGLVITDGDPRSAVARLDATGPVFVPGAVANTVVAGEHLLITNGPDVPTQQSWPRP